MRQKTRTKNTLSKLLGIAGFIFALVLVYSPGTVHATGISPAIFELDDAVSNVPITRVFYVSRLDTSTDEVIRLSGRGEAKEMLTFPDGDLQLFKKGEGSKKLRFTITPGNIAAGHYKAGVRAEQTQVSPETVAVLAGGIRSRKDLESVAAKSFAGAYNLSAAQLDIDMNVTNEVVEKWEVIDHDLRKAEEDTPISFNIMLENKGGVATKPGKVEIKIREEKGTEFLYNETVPGDRLELIPPYTTRPESILTDIRLKVGRYFAHIKVYDREGNIVYDSDKVFLEIVPAGTLAQAGKLLSLKVDKLLIKGADMPVYKPNEPAIITAVFGNTGQVGVRTTLTLEIYKDGEKLERLKSVEAFVPIAKEGEFNVDYTFEKEGIYVIKGFFTFGINKTNISEISVKVAHKLPEPEGEKGSVLKGSLGAVAPGSLPLLPLLASALFVAAGLVFLFVFYKKKAPIGAVCLWPDLYCEWPVCKLTSNAKPYTSQSTTSPITQQKP